MPITKSIAAPGSPEWHARRQRSFNASDAGAALGCDPNKTRSQLLYELHTGIQQEFSDYVRSRVVEPGHRIEALARPVAELVMGDDLMVLGGGLPVDGISRPLGASMDGITFMEDQAWECKRANEELRAALPHAGRGSADKNGPRALPKAKRAQMAQQQIIFGHKRTLFTAAEVDDAGNVIEERHCWYDAEPDLQREVIAAWKLIDADLATYVPPADAAKAVAHVVASLPVVFDMRVEGKLVSCNVEVYKPAALAYIGAINTTLTEDQHFANADADAKFCRDSADKLELSIELALGQMGDINAAIATVREIAAAFDAKGLQLEKAVKAEKDNIKLAQVKRAQAALAEHIVSLNKRLGAPYMPAIPADFGKVVMNKRTVESLRNAVDTELARAKIAANEIADKISLNLMALTAVGHPELFADRATIVLKSPDDFDALLINRIAAHKTAEAAKEADIIRKANIRARINQIKAGPAAALACSNSIQVQALIDQLKALPADGFDEFENEAIQARGYAVKAMIEVHVQRIFDERPAAIVEEPTPAAAAPAATPVAERSLGVEDVHPALTGYLPGPGAMLGKQFGEVLGGRSPVAAVASSPPTLRLGQIAERLGFNLTEQFMRDSLGILPAGRDKSAGLFHEHQWLPICAALVHHVNSVCELQAA